VAKLKFKTLLFALKNSIFAFILIKNQFMENPITKIKKVEIKGLWNRFDLSWTLNPDVNVLSGINGSGKSTILSAVAGLIMQGHLHDSLKKVIKEVIVTFNNNKKMFVTHKITSGNLKNIEKKAQESIKNLNTNGGNDYLINEAVEFQTIVSFLSLKELQMSLEELHKHLQADVISTFDNEIRDTRSKPDEHVNTELDRDIFGLQKEYLDYQLNISKKKDLIVDNQSITDIKKAIQELRQPQNRFLEIIDDLFGATDKKINRAKNEIMFTYGNQEITPYQLSSGEKQMLVILLTVLIQDLRPAVLFMDEPEISLHFDWQKKLIQYIRELNPNVQIILATHSPAVIMEGWLDKVFEVSDLVTPIKTNTKK
jgi:energy-coupling factor transporter ATP-binding protein EcfA2